MKIIIILFLITIIKLYSFELSQNELLYTSDVIKNTICESYCLETIISETNLLNLSFRTKEKYLNNLDIVKKPNIDDNYDGLFNFKSFQNFDSSFIIINIKPRFGDHTRTNFSDNTLRFILKKNGRVIYLRGFQSINRVDRISEIIESKDELMISYYYLLFNLDSEKFNFMIRNQDIILSSFNKKTDASYNEIHLFKFNNITYKVFNINSKLNYDVILE